MAMNMTYTLERLDTILGQPLLNISVNYFSIQLQIIALKCLLFSRYVQAKNIVGKTALVVFLPLFAGLNYVLNHLIGKRNEEVDAFSKHGVLFSLVYIYVVSKMPPMTTQFHGPDAERNRDIFGVMGIIFEFCLCLFCNNHPTFEALLDICIIVMFLHTLYYCRTFRDFIMTMQILILGGVMFLAVWWVTYIVMAIFIVVMMLTILLAQMRAIYTIFSA